MQSIFLKTLAIPLLALLTISAYAQEREAGAYYNNTKLSGQQVLDEEYGGISLTTVNGIHFTPRLSAGIGVGIHQLRDAANTIPIYLQGNYFFRDQARSPYVYANAGYGIAYLEDDRGGPVVEGGLGWQFRLGGITLGPEIGFRYFRYGNRLYYGGQSSNEYVYTNLNIITYGISLFF